MKSCLLLLYIFFMCRKISNLVSGAQKKALPYTKHFHFHIPSAFPSIFFTQPQRCLVFPEQLSQPSKIFNSLADCHALSFSRFSHNSENFLTFQGCVCEKLKLFFFFEAFFPFFHELLLDADAQKSFLIFYKFIF